MRQMVYASYQLDSQSAFPVGVHDELSLNASRPARPDIGESIMWNKALIALSAVITVTAASTAIAGPRQNQYLPQFSYETPENRIADRYPSLEQFKGPVAVRQLNAAPTRSARVTSLPQF